MKRSLGAAVAVATLLACAAGPSAQSSHGVVVRSAAALGAVDRAVDDAAADAYVAAALLNPALPIGPAQPCVRTDNGVSSRVTVLANPPLAESSLAQRVRLFEALAYYETAQSALAADGQRVEAALALGDLQRAAAALEPAARAHAQGDLFIEDEARTLASAVAAIGSARSPSDARRAALAAQPAIAKLIGVSARDAAQQRDAALGASQAAYARWLADDAALGRAAANGGAGAPTPGPLPRCAEPLVPAADGTPPPGIAAGGPNFPGRDALVQRLDAARARYDGLQAANPGPLFAALAALDDALAAAERAPGNPTALAAARTALDRFRSAADSFANAARALAGG